MRISYGLTCVRPQNSVFEVLAPVPQDVTQLGNRVVAYLIIQDEVMLGQGELWMQYITSVLMKKEKFGHRHTEGEHHVKMNAEMG